jgi:hypothetical protein
MRLGGHTLKLRPTEVLQDFFPVWRVVVAPQIRLQLAAQDLQRRTLSNTVCSNKSQYLTRAGHGQPMQLEAVGRVSMGDLSLEVRGQIDDIDSVERAFLRADTASYAKSFRDEGDL